MGQGDGGEARGPGRREAGPREWRAGSSPSYSGNSTESETNYARAAAKRSSPKSETPARRATNLPRGLRGRGGGQGPWVERVEAAQGTGRSVGVRGAPSPPSTLGVRFPLAPGFTPGPAPGPTTVCSRAGRAPARNSLAERAGRGGAPQAGGRPGWRTETRTRPTSALPSGAAGAPRARGGNAGQMAPHRRGSKGARGRPLTISAVAPGSDALGLPSSRSTPVRNGLTSMPGRRGYDGK